MKPFYLFILGIVSIYSPAYAVSTKVEEASNKNFGALGYEKIIKNMIDDSDTIVIAEYTGVTIKRKTRFSTLDSSYLFDFKVSSSLKGSASGNIFVNIMSKTISSQTADSYYQKGNRYLLLLSKQSLLNYNSVAEEDPATWYVLHHPSFAIELN